MDMAHDHLCQLVSIRKGDCAFSFSGLTLWSGLSVDIKNRLSLEKFKSVLTTYHSKVAFSDK